MLARISHQPSTAAADPGMSAALHSVGLLDVLSSTSAGPSVARLGARPRIERGRVPSATGADARRRDAGDVDVHRRGAPTQQMPLAARNPLGAWVLRAISALLVVNDVQ